MDRRDSNVLKERSSRQFSGLGDGQASQQSPLEQSFEDTTSL